MQVKLASKDKLRFLILKKTIKDKLPACFEVGAALREINEREFYKEDYETFEQFCTEEFHFGRAHAYRLIDAAEVKDSVSETVVGEKLQNEQQARALAKVPEEKRAKVLKVAAKSGDVTAEGITEAAKEVLKPEPAKPQKEPEKAPEVIRDHTGFPVPKQAQALLERDSEVLTMLSQIIKMKNTIQTAQLHKDPLWRLVNHAAIIADLSKAYTAISEGRPYAICNVCAGRPDIQPKGVVRFICQ